MPKPVSISPHIYRPLKRRVISGVCAAIAIRRGVECGRGADSFPHSRRCVLPCCGDHLLGLEVCDPRGRTSISI